MGGRYLARCARAQGNKKVPRPKGVVFFIVTARHDRCRLLAATNEKTTTFVVVFSLVDPKGFEPSTSRMRTERSPS